MDRASEQGLFARIQNGFEPRTVLGDVKKHLFTIIALSLAAALLMYVRGAKRYTPVYDVSATYVVTTRGANASLISNLSSAQQTAELLSRVVTSGPLMDAVAAELGLPYVPGAVSCEIVQETNLLVLRVTAGSPRMAFLILDSVMRNYPVVTDLIGRDVVMRVLVQPEIPTAPSNANDPLPGAVRTGTACLLALTLFFALASAARDTIRRGSEIERRLDAKYLGSIAHEEEYKTLGTRLRGVGTPILIDSPACSFRCIESVQKVCRAVQNSMERGGHKTLLVMSCEENEGKTTVAANLALALSQRGRRVLLMDLDLRNPSLMKLFDFDDEPITVLVDTLMCAPASGPLIEQMGEDGVCYIFNTKPCRRSTEILTNGRLERLLALLRERFDYIVMDTPPMSLTADAEALADMADAALMVVREHHTEARRIADALDALSGCRAEVIGAVLNDARASLGGGVGGYGYGADVRGSGYGTYYGRYYGSNA